MTGWPRRSEPKAEAGQDVIYVARPTGCMHLTASVNVILYDRLG
ncbi:RNA methyltransferase [Aeromonas caviae]|nr:RNA methyltransferase [Aeromonas caviae]